MVSHKLDNDNGIPKYADRRNLDLDDIVLVKSQVVGRHDAGAGQQHGAMGK
jgi:hypothetical protein